MQCYLLLLINNIIQYNICQYFNVNINLARETQIRNTLESLTLNSCSEMGKLGTQCSAFGCSKRKKSVKNKGELYRSESEGSVDEESGQKRKLPRTFHS